MKRAKIRYKVLQDGSIKIISWENVALRREIFEQNCSVGELYFSSIPRFCATRFAGKEKISILGEHIEYTFDPGEVLPQKIFEEVIKAMKCAGERLSSIIAFEKAAEVKEIEI